jgi:hypothetical protein
MGKILRKLAHARQRSAIGNTGYLSCFMTTNKIVDTASSFAVVLNEVSIKQDQRMVRKRGHESFCHVCAARRPKSDAGASPPHPMTITATQGKILQRSSRA